MFEFIEIYIRNIFKTHKYLLNNWVQNFVKYILILFISQVVKSSLKLSVVYGIRILEILLDSLRSIDWTKISQNWKCLFVEFNNNIFVPFKRLTGAVLATLQREFFGKLKIWQKSNRTWIYLFYHTYLVRFHIFVLLVFKVTNRGIIHSKFHVNYTLMGFYLICIIKSRYETALARQSFST